ncbi:MAG TPA: MXAN_5187 C-terminal domain-containing protein [Kofleriaceae bacterium]|nr:MXAN_5187 C-terminal domain-containing protein [Kofleriaceae bacterium]
MATKSGQPESGKAEVVEALLDTLDTALDRVKILYEQYFLGIQKQPPSFLHTDVERQIRDITQLQVRNTALRYRFATLQQKFGSYNTYWRRTLRQIESGTYMRNLSKIGRQAARTGAAVPEEVLAAMPKRMREQVKRDRQAALALAELRKLPSGDDLELLTLTDDQVDDPALAAVLRESAEPRQKVGQKMGPILRELAEPRQDVPTAGGAHRVDASDADFDLDAFFTSITTSTSEDPLSPPIDAPVIRWRTSVRPPGAELPSAGPVNTGSPGAGPSKSPPHPGGAERPSGERSSIASSSAGPPIGLRPISGPSGSGAPTVRLLNPRTGRPSGGRSSSGPPGSGSPVTEPAASGLPNTRQPDGGPQGFDAGPVSVEPPSTGAGPPEGSAGPSSTERPRAVRLNIQRSSAGQPTTRLLNPHVRRTSTAPASAGAEPASAGPSESGARPLQSGLPQPDGELPGTGPFNLGSPSDEQSTARLLSPGAGRWMAEPPSGDTEPSGSGARALGGSPGLSSVEFLGTGQASPGPLNDDQSTARVWNPGTGPWTTGQPGSGAGSPGAEPPGPGQPGQPGQPNPGQLSQLNQLSDDQPTARIGALSDDQPTARIGQLSDDQSTARMWSPGARRPTPGQLSLTPPSAGTEPPSAGAGRPPPPPIGGRAAPPKPVPPAIRSAPVQAAPPASSPPPPAMARPAPPRPPAPAPSQATRPSPVSSGAAAPRAPAAVETPSGPLPRIPGPPPVPNKPRPPSSAPPAAEPPPIPAPRVASVPPVPNPAPPAVERPPANEPYVAASGERPSLARPPSPPRPPPLPPLRAAAGERRPPEPRQALPPGMSDAEVNALYTKYVQAKQTLGEDAGPDAYSKLLKTIHTQAPKIMEQYKATGVDFSVIVKDNQVIIRARPKP